jgi:DNA invertase Pin-like site-specific DNA recombinase
MQWWGRVRKKNVMPLYVGIWSSSDLAAAEWDELGLTQPLVCERMDDMLLGYGRVSKGEEQSDALQVEALERAGCARIFAETASGGRWERPALHRMLDQLRPGDVVVVWKLDRLTRSLKDLLLIMEKIDTAGAGFRSLTESIDTTTPAGRMMMQMVGTFAEFERAVIRERTTAGLATARAKGRRGGRKPSLDEEQKADIADNVLSGRKTGADMARLYKVSQATITRTVAEARLKREDLSA